MGFLLSCRHCLEDIKILQWKKLTQSLSSLDYWVCAWQAHQISKTGRFSVKGQTAKTSGVVDPGLCHSYPSLLLQCAKSYTTHKGKCVSVPRKPYYKNGWWNQFWLWALVCQTLAKTVNRPLQRTTISGKDVWHCQRMWKGTQCMTWDLKDKKKLGEQRRRQRGW